MTNRFDEIDICKGLGIVLVVLGHALKQTGTGRAAIAIPLSVIYSFHMPLFFILSGFLSVRLLDLEGGPFSGERRRYLKDRAARLLIPYAVMSLLYVPLKLFMNRYALKAWELKDAWRILIGDSPNTAMWFLYILFLCCAVCALLARRANLQLFFFAAMLFSSAAYALNWQIRFPRYFIFFILGLLVRENYGRCRAVLEDIRFLVPSLLFFVTGNVAGYLYGGLWFFLTAITGSYLLWALADFLSDRTGVYERRGCKKRMCALVGLIRTAGRASMDLYIFSEPVITAVRLLGWNLLHLPAPLCILLCLAGGLFLPLPLCRHVIRKIRPLRLLFLGEA